MLEVNVKLKGGLFAGGIPRRVERIIVEETLNKVEHRTKRGGKGLGVQRNTIMHSRQGLELEVHSTTRSPRTTGRSWQKKNVGVVKAMAPRVMNATAKKIAEEMS